MDRKINRIYLSVFWLVLTVSLGVWWLFLGLRQANTISELTQALGEPYSTLGYNLLEKQSRMIWMEGAFFISMLTLGGSVLIWLSYRDLQLHQLIQDFFSTVTHEMKTPLAGLRLQVEGLLEDLGEDSPHATILKRALNDSDRIESQMDKAFYLASIMRSESLYLEKTEIQEIQEIFTETYPQVTWLFQESKPIFADKRALESILKNLIENATKHGQATEIQIHVQTDPKSTKILVSDNGAGFKGDWKNLGKPFIRHSTTSGTGIGIYIIKGLVKKMNGQISFQSDKKGFHVRIDLPNWKGN
jgi:signal transduction histidine kinase